MNSPKTIARAALYNLVWSKPCRAVAEELGISDVAVGKICRKLEVPKRKRGFWAKQAHGKAVKAIPLKSCSVETAATAKPIEDGLSAGLHANSGSIEKSLAGICGYQNRPFGPPD